MFYRAEAIIQPQNRDEVRRIFVTEGLERDRFCHLAGRIMDVYADVTGKVFSEYDRRDYPGSIVDELEDEGHFELRFGMPRLGRPARDHGKLWGRAGRLSVSGEELKTVGFWTDTNDFDALRPQPEPSQALDDSFDLAVKSLADGEFSDITVPVPPTAFSYMFYDPAQVR